MKQGFIKVAAVTVDIRVADVWHNCKEICKRMKEAEKAGAKIAEHLQKLQKRPGIQKHLYLLGFHLQLMESFIMLRPH